VGGWKIAAGRWVEEGSDGELVRWGRDGGLGQEGVLEEGRGTVLSVLGTGEAGSRVCGREVE
jgi:hypothetical protein